MGGVYPALRGVQAGMGASLNHLCTLVTRAAHEDGISPWCRTGALA
jgi:hypothetical protein